MDLLDADGVLSFPGIFIGAITLYSVQYLANGRKLLAEGYKKYPNSIFRIAVHDGWLIVANGPQLVEETCCAFDAVLSFTEAAVRIIQLEYTIGNDILDAPYHVDVIRGALTQNIGARFDIMRDEIVVAFGDEIDTSEGWKEIPAVETVRRIVTRVSNRVFVDIPFCVYHILSCRSSDGRTGRNAEWIQQNIEYAIDVALGAMFVKSAPRSLKPLAGRLLWKLKSQERRESDLVGPLIAERLREFAEHGDKAEDLPNDMITWLIEVSPPELRQVPAITKRVLLVNVSSLHTTTNTFLHVLYKIAANPAWVEPLREEVGRIVSAEGWTKASLAKMRRLDSFIRETQRI
ncbi:cytochrome P450 [Peniophora sp. CONT]|nr:cytochrome P450 [Peniophora sp. CONT]